jgi:predicted protein tyrosine phosphatase
MKILTMCAGGHVRSVGMKYLLTYKYGHEALACGQDSNSPETIEMLCQWADYVVVMSPEYEKFVPQKYHFKENGERKLFCYNVGPDRFGTAFHPELQKMIQVMIQQHGLFLKK